MGLADLDSGWRVEPGQPAANGSTGPGRQPPRQRRVPRGGHWSTPCSTVTFGSTPADPAGLALPVR
ncbi:hypothetical protein [Kitasatospora sp. NPDC005856]|uniref:hypothetical protein n=1 Tax=Kitasatospora sp. NPDC005856 TaxID=3154566 RepID=UPI00340B35E7